MFAIEGDNRQFGRHRFHYDVRPAFIGGREHEDIRRLDPLSRPLRETGKGDAIVQPQTFALLLQLGAPLAFAPDNQVPVRKVGRDPGECIDQQMKLFLFRKPADRSDRPVSAAIFPGFGQVHRVGYDGRAGPLSLRIVFGCTPRHGHEREGFWIGIRTRRAPEGIELLQLRVVSLGHDHGHAQAPSCQNRHDVRFRQEADHRVRLELPIDPLKSLDASPGLQELSRQPGRGSGQIETEERDLLCQGIERCEVWPVEVGDADIVSLFGPVVRKCRDNALTTPRAQRRQDEEDARFACMSALGRFRSDGVHSQPSSRCLRRLCALHVWPTPG